jgi:hypothetical protein
MSRWSTVFTHPAFVPAEFRDLLEEAVTNPEGSVFVPLAGGVMTGQLTLPGDPTAPLSAATKRYVDANAGGGGLIDAPLDGNIYGRHDGAWQNLTTGAGAFLPLSGGALTGMLSLAGAPTSPAHAATKAYVDSGGRTVTGDITITGSATAPNEVIFRAIDPSAPKANNASQFNGYLVDQSSGGQFSDMYCNARFDCTMQGNSSTGITGVLSQMTYDGTGGSAGYVPFYGQFSRRTVNAGGTASNPQIWGAVLEVIDWTNTDSAQTNAMSGIEIDMTCGNTDSAGNRRGFGMYLDKANSTDVAPVIATGMHIAANVGSYNTMLKLESPFNIAAIDLRLASATVGTAHTIWLKTGGSIALDTPASIELVGDGVGGMILAGAATQPARIIFQPGSGVKSWWAGAWEDGNFYIADNTSSINRVTITAAGAFTLNGPTIIDGELTVSAASAALSMSFTTLPINAANDAAAATAGVPVGGVYRNGSALMVRTV